MQGSGKSSILNHLANHFRQTPPNDSSKSKTRENKENESLNNNPDRKAKGDITNRTKEKNSAAPTEGTTITGNHLEEVFREQSFEKQMLAEHCTSGIKAWISPTTRVIFLDSQPLNSISVLGKYLILALVDRYI